MGKLTIALLLAFPVWVAWAMPLYDRGDDPLVDPQVFLWAAAIGVLASAAWWMIRFIARKAKG